MWKLRMNWELDLLLELIRNGKFLSPSSSRILSERWSKNFLWLFLATFLLLASLETPSCGYWRTVPEDSTVSRQTWTLPCRIIEEDFDRPVETRQGHELTRLIAILVLKLFCIRIVSCHVFSRKAHFFLFQHRTLELFHSLRTPIFPINFSCYHEWKQMRFLKYLRFFFFSMWNGFPINWLRNWITSFYRIELSTLKLIVRLRNGNK